MSNPTRHLRQACLALLCLASLSPLAMAEPLSSPWLAQADPPAATTTAPGGKINPRLKLNAPYNAKISIINPFTRPLLIASANGVRVRDLVGNYDKGGLDKDVEFSSNPVASPDGKYLVVRKGRGNDNAGTLDVYEARNGKLLIQLPHPELEATPLVFVDNTRFLISLAASNSFDRARKPTMRLVSATDGAVASEFTLEEKPNSVRLSPGGGFVAVVTRRGIVLYRLKTGEVAGRLDMRDSSSADVAFSPDGSELAVLTERGQGENLLIYSLANGEVLARFTAGNRYGGGFDSNNNSPPVQYFPNGKALLVGTQLIDRHSGRAVLDFGGSNHYSSYRSLGARWVVGDDLTITFKEAPRDSKRSWEERYELVVEQFVRPKSDAPSAASAGAANGSAGAATGATAAATANIERARATGEPVLPEGANYLRFDTPASDQRFTPDPARTADSTVKLRDNLVLRPRLSISTLLPAGPNSTQVVVASAPPPTVGPAMAVAPGTNAGPPPTLLLERFDLASATSTGRVECDPNNEPLAVSTDGSLVAVRVPTFDAGDERLEVYAFNGKGKAVHDWTPYLATGTPGKIAWAGFIDNTHLVTLGSNRIAICWELNPSAPPQAKWACSANFVGFSASRKITAISGQRTNLIDSLTGDLVAGIDARGIPEFSPDGRSLALFENQPGGAEVTVVDLTSDKPMVQVSMPGFSRVDPRGRSVMPLPPAWLSQDYLLVDGRYIIDIKRHIPLWCFNFEATDPRPIVLMGKCIYPVETDASRRAWTLQTPVYAPGRNTPLPSTLQRTYNLAVVELPTPEILRRTANQSRDSLPGTRGKDITINFKNVSADTTKAIEEAITRMGYKIAPASQTLLTITLRTVQAPSNRITYRSADGSPVTLTVEGYRSDSGSSVTATRSMGKQNQLTFSMDFAGKAIWREGAVTDFVGEEFGSSGKFDQAAFDALLEEKTIVMAEMMVKRIPSSTSNTIQVYRSRLPRITPNLDKPPTMIYGVSPDGYVKYYRPDRYCAPADEASERAALKVLATIVPQLVKILDSADALLTYSSAENAEPKTFGGKVTELERLLAALPREDATDALLPGEADAYTRAVENLTGAVRQFRMATNVNIPSGVTSVSYYIARHVQAAREFLVAGATPEIDFLLKHAEDLAQKRMTPKP